MLAAPTVPIDANYCDKMAPTRKAKPEGRRSSERQQLARAIEQSKKDVRLPSLASRNFTNAEQNLRPHHKASPSASVSADRNSGRVATS